MISYETGNGRLVGWKTVPKPLVDRARRARIKLQKLDECREEAQAAFLDLIEELEAMGRFGWMNPDVQQMIRQLALYLNLMEEDHDPF